MGWSEWKNFGDGGSLKTLEIAIPSNTIIKDSTVTVTGELPVGLDESQISVGFANIDYREPYQGTIGTLVSRDILWTYNSTTGNITITVPFLTSGYNAQLGYKSTQRLLVSYVEGGSSGAGDNEITISSINDLDLLIEFTNRFPDAVCNGAQGRITLRSNIFKHLKSFTFSFKAVAFSSYLRYVDSSNTIQNIWGTNYGEQGANSNAVLEKTLTVDCTGAPSVFQDVFFYFDYVYAATTFQGYFKILSYELL